MWLVVVAAPHPLLHLLHPILRHLPPPAAVAAAVDTTTHHHSPEVSPPHPQPFDEGLMLHHTLHTNQVDQMESLPLEMFVE